ncbi:MAG: transglutaminase family protein [Proteobacteria bacterium]|nr:transglutaminase family protein [Burkholderiales bacterium]
MARYRIDCELTYEIDAVPADLIFNIEAAQRLGQKVLDETLSVSVPGEVDRFTDPTTGNRFLRIQGQHGSLRVHYQADVEKTPYVPTEQECEVAVNALPLDVIPYIYPSRYCESDALIGLATRLFGNVPTGYTRVRTIIDWTRDNIAYEIGTSNASTTARDVLLNRVGVCRDFAHVCIALCRAMNIPARIVTGYAAFEFPPPDFHAIFEAYLDQRWILFDPTRLSPEVDFIRIGTARDAADVAFATLFGAIRMTSWRPDVARVDSELVEAA